MLIMCKLSLSLLVWLAVVAASQGFGEKQVGHLSTPDLYSKNTPLGIYKGKTTTIEKHPYLVSIWEEDTLLGAAAIISRRWIAISGDLKGDKLSQVRLVAGSSDGNIGKNYTIKKLVVHPKYSLYSYDYDYGLAQINGQFKWSKKTKPIKLATKQPKANTLMVVAAWGDPAGPFGTIKEGDDSNVLTQGTMKWLSKKACDAAYQGYNITFTSRFGCVYNKGKTTLCRGDWSAPFVYKNLLYGYFIGQPGKWCSHNSQPDLVANVPTMASWMKKITGAKTEDDEY